MTAPAPARPWLASARGQAALFGATLASAVVLAAVMANARPFFEGLGTQKLAPPSPEVAALVGSVRAAALAPSAAEQALGDRADELYRAWLAARALPPDEAGDRRHAELLARLDGPRLAERVERTALSGSREQKLRALALATQITAPGLADVSAACVERAARARDDELRAVCEAGVRHAARGR